MKLVNRRAAHEPYEYIVGSASFYDIHLTVEPGVLIPRPETEILIDLTAEIIEKNKIKSIAEIGVGTGAISIILARKFDEDIELLVSNPPYIAEDFLLKSNVIDYEPKEALFGGRAGDELLKQIILDVKERGIKYLACEMGYDQKEPIASFVNKLGVKSIKFYKDLAGFDKHGWDLKY